MAQKPKNIKTLAEEAGLSPQTVYSRLAKGWTLKKALSKPARQYNKQGKKVDNLDNIVLEINKRKEEEEANQRPHALDKVLVWATIASVIGALVGAFIGASL